MCGFIGVVHANGAPDLKAAWSAVAWRGEIFGAWQSEEAVILAARLPRSGNLDRPQPIVLPDESVLAFNGEAYNLPEIVRRMGIAVKDNAQLSDAELLASILNGTVDYRELLSCIKGEFAFAFYDNTRKLLWLARDPLGSKPLFWAIKQQQIYFGSSAKSVAILYDEQLAADWPAVRDIMEFGVTPAANIFRNVRSVAAGELICISERDIARSSIRPAPVKADPALIERQLSAAVGYRASGKDTALAFSGGVDSSLIRAIRPELPAYTLHTAPLPVDGHQTGIYLTSENLYDAYLTLCPKLDRPLSTLSPAAMYLLAEKVRADGFENMLTGEGADELFCGYPHYYDPVRKGHPVLRHHQHLFKIGREILQLDMPAGPSDIFASLLESDDPARWLRFDREVRLPQHLLLLHTDLPSLMNGIEARVPYLDLIDIAADDPRHMQQPKQPLRALLQHKGAGQQEYYKSGLHIPCSIFTDALLLDLADECTAFDAVRTPATWAQTCRAALGNINRLPAALQESVREIIARIILQLHSLHHILKLPMERHAIASCFTFIPHDGMPTVKTRCA